MVTTPDMLARLSPIARVLLRSEADAWPSLEQVNWQATMGVLLEQMSERQRADLNKLLWLIEWVLPLRGGVLPPFSRRDVAKQTRVLEAMMLSSVPQLRGAFDSLKALCCLAYFSHSSTWPLIGYEGPR